jgi:mannose/cellobiose epimerase-like protein (N-acyl-D-glucosamine 2-epimerase family)
MAVFLQEQSQRAREWFLNSACPLWLERGVDWKNGGFFDSLDLLHARNASERKRLRVATRQIFVFSCALDFGFEDGRRVVTHGLEFLFEHARHPGGGFTSDFDLSLAKTSERRDSYDLAFVILALAHSYRHFEDARLLEEALALAHFFENRLRHPAGGFIEGLPAQLPR